MDQTLTYHQKKPKHAALSEWAYSQIREWIINLKLLPGSRLVQADLANLLGVSNNPIRTALVELEQEGLVLEASNKGVYVAPIQLDQLHDIFQLREVLLSYATRSAVDNFKEADFKKLEKSIELQEQAIKSHDYEKLYLATDQFHDITIMALNNQRISRIYHEMSGHHSRLRIVLKGLIDNIAQVPIGHINILSAIRNKNVEVAIQIQVDNIWNFYKYIEKADQLGMLSGEALSATYTTTVLVSQ